MSKTKPWLIVSTLATALCFSSQAPCAEVDPDDLKLINEAGCVDIVREHKSYSAAEKSVADEIRQSGNSTVATNVLGVATMAAFGLGFFTWDDHSDARENLAELTAYREAIEAAAKKKGCVLQAPIGGQK